MSGTPARLLAALYADDLRDHASVPPVGSAEYALLRARDRERRVRADLALAALRRVEGPSAESLYHAAWLHQHGELPSDAWRAHELAREAGELGYRPARWLAAAAYDRWCMYSGRPQRFGTQLVPDGVRHRVWDVEPATTDAERARWDVPPLAQQHARADALTRSEPQPPMELAPDWLRPALARWRAEREAAAVSGDPAGDRAWRTAPDDTTLAPADVSRRPEHPRTPLPRPQPRHRHPGVAGPAGAAPSPVLAAHMLNFPLDLRFKLLAIASQITVRDATGAVRFSVRQKAFKLKEAVTVYADEAQTTPVYRIGADRIIDFSAQYAIEDVSGRTLGVIKRQGMRSLWRSRYDVTRDGAAVFAIQEANPWVSVADGLFGQIPVLGAFSGYLFHPAYRVTRVDTGAEAFRVTKQAAFFEGRFRMDAHESPGGADEELAVAAVLMMVLLERADG